MISDFSVQQVQQFQEDILSWYTKNKRDLPWRKTHDPYKILISEIMLQQTQVTRVIPKYEAWLEKFPTIECLVTAKKEEILRLWSGLGYNRRALFLQKCAIALQIRKTENVKLKTKKNVIRHDNSWYWPKTVEELEKLPGIGPYTARAIACFAFNQQVAVVDTNVRRVILLKFLGHNSQNLSHKQSRIKEETKRKKVHNSSFILRASARQKDSISKKEIAAIAEEILPTGRAYDWNQALMDYSNIVLQKEKVPTKKQSRFKNSNRYYRGKLLRLLLTRNDIPLQQVGLLLKDDYAAQDKDWSNKLLEGLQKDGLLYIKDGKVSI